MLVLLLLALPVSVSAQAADEELIADLVAGGMSSAMSSTRRFFATGATALENVELAGWAEEVAGRCAEVIGWPPPFQRNYPLVIAVRGGEGGASAGGVAVAQEAERGGVHQKLVVFDVAAVDQEDVLEALCTLLLARYVSEARSAAGEGWAGPDDVPAWLACGVAQNIYPVLRSRNGSVVFTAWEQGRAPSFAELLALDRMPAGRWLEKAAAGAAMTWLDTLPAGEDRFRTLFRRLAEGGPVSPEWAASDLAGLPSVRDLEQDWDLWIAQRRDVRSDLGTVGRADIAALRERLAVSPELLRLVTGQEAAADLAFEDLIDKHAEPWMPALAVFVGLQVRALGVGRAAEFRRVVDLYGSFLDEVARGGRRGIVARWRRSSRPQVLRERLRQAHLALAAIEQRAGTAGEQAAPTGAPEAWESLAGKGEQMRGPSSLPGADLLPSRPAGAAPGR